MKNIMLNEDFNQLIAGVNVSMGPEVKNGQWFKLSILAIANILPFA